MVPEPVNERFDRIDQVLIEQDKKLDKILLCWEMRQETCPYRDRVVHNTAEIITHGVRLIAVEELTLQQRLASARAGLIGGVGGVSVAAILVEVARLLKWI